MIFMVYQKKSDDISEFFYNKYYGLKICRIKHFFTVYKRMGRPEHDDDVFHASCFSKKHLSLNNFYM